MGFRGFKTMCKIYITKIMTTYETVNELSSAINKSITALEFNAIKEVVSMYDIEDIECYTADLTDTDKGVFGSLVKKELIYDSYEGMNEEIGVKGHNFFPATIVLDAYNLERY